MDRRPVIGVCLAAVGTVPDVDELLLDGVHAVAKHVDRVEYLVSEGGVGATMRLVLESPAGFPLDQHAAHLAPEYRNLPRERCTELSRLIVDRRYRAARAERPLLLSLMGEAYREGSRLGIEHVLAAMEPRLARLLGRIGFRFRPIGPPIQHFGEVVPYYAPISDLTPGYRRIAALGLATGDLVSFRCLKVSPDAVEASV